MFYEGQWVKIPKGKIGFIREIIYSKWHDKVKISVFSPQEGKYYFLDEEECEDSEALNVPKEDLLSLTDLALDTKDIEWLKELTK